MDAWLRRAGGRRYGPDVRPLVRTSVVLTLVCITLALVAPGAAAARKYALGDSVMRGATQELRAHGSR